MSNPPAIIFTAEDSATIGNRGEIVTVRAEFCRPIQLTAALLLLFTTSTIPGHPIQTSRQTGLSRASNTLAEAQSALAQGDPTKAVAILLRYLQAHPKDIPVRLALGQAYAIGGQNQQAQTEFQTVLTQAPSNITALVSVGDIYLLQGQLNKAEAMLGRAARASGSVGLRMQWAVVLARLHKFKEAKIALANLTPPSAPEECIQFHRLKASVASGLGNRSEAAAEMEQALALQPHDVGLTMATAVAELQSGKWQAAASLAEPLYSRTHDPQVGVIFLEAQLGMHGDFHKTLELLRATQLHPAEELPLRQRLAEILITHGEFSASIEDLTRAVELDPNRGDLAYNLALAQFKAGRLDDSLQSAEKCRALGDTADVEDLLGDIQEARGDNLAAVRSYQAAVTLSPNEQKYRLSLAIEFVRHKNFDAAGVIVKQAERLWPKSWRIQLVWGMVEYFAGSDEEASRILIHAAELAPEPETALGYLGNIQMNQASAPSSAAIERLCGYSDRHSPDGKLQFYCGALLFRRDYLTGEKTHVNDILRRLHISANLPAKDAAPHCQLAKVYRWIEKWQDARRESETCVRMDPNSADGHYRLAQIYQHLGERELSQQEIRIYQAASQRIADENARRDETMKTFLYTIQQETSDHR